MMDLIVIDCRYPLAVKLGTITPHGADVYSYAPEEDNMVKASFTDISPRYIVRFILCVYTYVPSHYSFKVVVYSHPKRARCIGLP